MKYISLDIRFEGSKFYPSKLMNRINLPIKELAEYGKISLKGRYKGTPSPYGIGLLEMSENDKQKNIPDLIQFYSAKLIAHKDDLSVCGVESIIFDIESSKDQADISLSQDILKSLSALNAKIEFHSISHTGEVNIIERIKAKIQNSNKAKVYQNILDKWQNHPSISEASLFSYLLYFYSENSTDKEVDEDLNKFDIFYKEVAEH